MVDNKRLDELMSEKYPHLVYTAEQANEFLKNYSGNLSDEDVVAWDFAEHVSTWRDYAHLSTNKLNALLKTTDDAKIISVISALIKARQDAARDSEDKFIVIKKIGSFGETVIRLFDNEHSAKQFVTLMRESETKDFIKYSIAQMIHY